MARRRLFRHAFGSFSLLFDFLFRIVSPYGRTQYALSSLVCFFFYYIFLVELLTDNSRVCSLTGITISGTVVAYSECLWGPNYTISIFRRTLGRQKKVKCAAREDFALLIDILGVAC